MTAVSMDQAPVGAARRPRALTTRALDFWLLGGASLVVWGVLKVLDGYRGEEPARMALIRIAAIFGVGNFVVNFPHFMASYRLGYGQGDAFVLKNVVALLLVPLGLVGAIAFAFLTWDGMGLPTLRVLVLLMFVTVGWHYGKQVYGCMMVYAHYDGYALEARQRLVLRAAALAVWVGSFLAYRAGGASIELRSLRVRGLDLPQALVPVGLAAAAAGAVAVVVLVLVPRWRAGQRPSANFLVPLVAFYVWWTPPFYQYDYYLVAVPFFHSLQYLPFVYKVEAAGVRRRGPRAVGKAVLLALGLVVAGWLSFERLPWMADQLTFREAGGIKVPFFILALTVFINIHHYFIDAVIWRFKDRHVRDRLLG